MKKILLFSLFIFGIMLISCNSSLSDSMMIMSDSGYLYEDEDDIPQIIGFEYSYDGGVIRYPYIADENGTSVLNDEIYSLCVSPFTDSGLSADYEVVFFSDSVFSFIFTTEKSDKEVSSYYYTFNLKSGKQLDIDDLILTNAHNKSVIIDAFVTTSGDTAVLPQDFWDIHFCIGGDDIIFYSLNGLSVRIKTDAFEK